MNVHAPQVEGEPTIDRTDADWWRGAVIYQIYPRSFQDTSGDGIGDLAGIADRLDHVASLGVDAIWISPFFTSPMKDFGYDVSDYRNVDPMFGTLHDFDRLVSEAHARGLRVMIDLVLSHTSDQHPWFVDARTSREAEHSDWYVWADPEPDGTPPNNWLSIFGGPAWAWNAKRRQYYLHNFLESQPDLNFHNPAVQDALLDVVRFWLDRGVDGFRLDTVNFYFCDAELRSNPPLDPERINSFGAGTLNPYNFQDHVRDKNQPENLAFMERLRAVMDEYEARTIVGEVGDAQYQVEIIADYTAPGRIHMCYSFDMLGDEPLDAARARALVETYEERITQGWVCWAYSNHDVTRHATRWADVLTDDPSDRDGYLRLVTGVLLSLRGTVCLYQGEELGLPEADVPFEQLQDPYGIRFWPEFKGRDGCRTPMPWEADALNAGFSDGDPWLPVSPEHRALAASAQAVQHGSMLNHYRAMLTFRAAHPALAKGSIRFLDWGEDVLAFERDHGNETLVCAFNMSAKAKALDLSGLRPFEDAPFAGPYKMQDGDMLPPWGAAFAYRD